MILSLFSAKPEHPLADAKELRRAIAELPLDNAFKAVDEVLAWFESLLSAEGFKPEQLFDTVRQLDEAAQPHLRRLTRDYLHSPRLSKTEERRLWTASTAFWDLLARLYEQSLARYRGKEKGADALKPHLSLIHARLILAYGNQLKWRQYHYGPVEGGIWLRLGQAYLAAESEGVTGRLLLLYPGQSSSSSATLEYLKVLMFHASSMDSLLPAEIELAERLIGHCLPQFVFGSRSGPESVYWIDPAQPLPPVRLTREPQAAPTLRFFAPGNAPQTLAELIRSVELGTVPEEVNLGGQYPARMILPVLHHLAMHWAPTPPLREHRRHQVKSLLTVVNGFEAAFQVFSGKPDGDGAAESWIADNVSLGGFGALVPNLRGDWLRIGALLAMQPEGGSNWLLGVVRRYGRESDTQAAVGIQTLARQALAVELRPRSTSAYALAAGIPGMLLRDGMEEGEVRVVMPPASFDVRENLECEAEGRHLLLTPMDIQESGSDYEIARYRELRSDN